MRLGKMWGECPEIFKNVDLSINGSPAEGAIYVTCIHEGLGYKLTYTVEDIKMRREVGEQIQKVAKLMYEKIKIRDYDFKP